MTVYRPTVEVWVQGGPVEKYHATWVSLNNPTKYSDNKLEDFVAHARFLYWSHNILTDGKLVEKYWMDDTEIKISYKELKFNPLKDIWCALKQFVYRCIM